MKKITFRSIYDVRWRKFNVTSEGVKVERDVNGNEFITGSADNVKHCIVEIMCQNDGYIRPKKIFEKTFNKNVRKKGIKKYIEDSEKINQGGLVTPIDLFNPLTTLGCWDSTSRNEESKYKGIAIKSSVNFGYFLPFSTDLVTITNREYRNGTRTGATGVCVGNDKDSIVFTIEESGNKTKRYRTPEELFEDGLGTFEECVSVFNNERKMNTYDKSPLVSGLYTLECEIDMDMFGRYRLYDVKLAEEMCGEFIEKGWKIVEVNGQKYLEMPEDERKKLFASLVKAIHEFEFMSNNSAAGNPLRLVRMSFGYRAAQKVCESSLYDKFEKEIVINDNINGVQSFNTPLIREWVNVKELGIEIDENPIDHSIEKMIELGESLIK